MTSLLIFAVVLFVVIYYVISKLDRIKDNPPQQPHVVEGLYEKMDMINVTSTEKQPRYKEMYEGKDFLNKDTSTLEMFIINEQISSLDLYKLADLNDIQLQIHSGWHQLLIELLIELDQLGWNRKISCIKEKYASLRFYTDHRFSDVVDRYERRSKQVCETCGEHGEIRSRTGWDYVACWPHYRTDMGEVEISADGFSYNKVHYKWREVKGIQLEDSNQWWDDKTLETPYRWLIISFHHNLAQVKGWEHDKVYIYHHALGFGKFLLAIFQMHHKFNGLDYNYIERNFLQAQYCEVCGYQAIYVGECECCERNTWEYSKHLYTNVSPLERLKSQQLSWAAEGGVTYEQQKLHYAKNPDFKTSYTQKELKEYLNYDYSNDDEF